MKFDPKDRCGSFAEIDYLLKVNFFLIIKQNMLNQKTEPKLIPPQNVN